MAWFFNHFQCVHCGSEWADEWSCMCDDDCPRCGLNLSPYTSDDLTEIIVREEASFAVYCSPETAGHYPEYRKVAAFATAEEAARFISDPQLSG
jgi:predicted  nucleic acid-binding Zn-ribbon protein